jgi:hypothetical protein
VRKTIEKSTKVGGFERGAPRRMARSLKELFAPPHRCGHSPHQWFCSMRLMPEKIRAVVCQGLLVQADWLLREFQPIPVVRSIVNGP